MCKLDFNALMKDSHEEQYVSKTSLFAGMITDFRVPFPTFKLLNSYLVCIPQLEERINWNNLAYPALAF